MVFDTYNITENEKMYIENNLAGDPKIDIDKNIKSNLNEQQETNVLQNKISVLQKK